MKTQAIKLAKVLHNGTLRQVKLAELIQEHDELYKKVRLGKAASIYSEKENFTNIQRNILNGNVCWEFNPYPNIDAEKIRMFCNNPFILVNFVYKDLIS